jgi:transposase InsO family protein
VLSAHGCGIDPSTYYRAAKREPSARAVRDAELKDLITRVHSENFGVYGVREVRRETNRRGEAVARCTVERLMRELGPSGAVRGRKVRTTVPDPSAESAPDLVKGNFVASAPNRCWVADFTYVQAYRGTVYVAFVVDTFSRRIIGWSAATSKAAPLVLGAPEMGSWQRDRAGRERGGLIHHSDAGSQYTSFRLAAHPAGENIAASIGTVGDALDNALMESTIGLYKTELIKRRGPWRTLTDVELGTAEWIDWYNNRRLHGEIGHVPPVEYETAFYLSQPNLQLEAQT